MCDYYEPRNGLLTWPVAWLSAIIKMSYAWNNKFKYNNILFTIYLSEQLLQTALFSSAPPSHDIKKINKKKNFACSSLHRTGGKCALIHLYYICYVVYFDRLTVFVVLRESTSAAHS